MARLIKFDTKYTRTYKSEANAIHAVEMLQLENNIRYLILPIEGRFTPVFFLSLNDPTQSCYLASLASKGYKVIG